VIGPVKTPYPRPNNGLVFDLPPWFIGMYRDELRTLEWRQDQRQAFNVKFLGEGTRKITLHSSIEHGKTIIRPIEKDRFKLFKEEFLREPI
jgi:hypothetical protein